MTIFSEIKNRLIAIKNVLNEEIPEDLEYRSLFFKHLDRAIDVFNEESLELPQDLNFLKSPERRARVAAARERAESVLTIDPLELAMMALGNALMVYREDFADRLPEDGNTKLSKAINQLFKMDTLLNNAYRPMASDDSGAGVSP